MYLLRKTETKEILGGWTAKFEALYQIRNSKIDISDKEFIRVDHGMLRPTEELDVFRYDLEKEIRRISE